MKPGIRFFPLALARQLKLLRSQHARFVAAVLGGLMLTGCAQLPPLVEQLKTNQKTHVTLLVEDGPFQYTTPASIDAGGGGLLIIALITAVAALAAQTALDGANTRLATSLGKDRRLYRPVADKLPPLGDNPLFILHFDAGTCSFGSVAPCIRYMFHQYSRPVKAGAPLLAGSSDPFRAAAMTSPPSPPPSAVRYRGAWGTSPDRSKPDAAGFKTFASVDDAVLNVAEFDKELSKIVPFAADELVSWLESTPTRAASAATNPPAPR
jgi:hypothetical protein